MAVRNPTKWFPPSGTGFVLNPGVAFIIANNKNFLVTNTGKFLITNGYQVVGKYATAWSLSGA